MTQQEWFCERCGKKGAIEIVDGDAAYAVVQDIRDVIQDIRDEHARASPDCRVNGVRINLRDHALNRPRD